MSRLKSRLLHYPMKNPLFVGERTALVAATQGRVLEICFETERNVPYYSPWVTDLSIMSYGGAAAESRRGSNERGLGIERIFPGSDALKLPFEDARFDWVVSTLTLCRLRHPEAILREIGRVLKPSGAYIFIEHGRSREPSMRWWQHRLRKLWLRIGGCDIDRDVEAMLGASGLQLHKYETYQLKHPKFLSMMCRGIARPGKGESGEAVR